MTSVGDDAKADDGGDVISKRETKVPNYWYGKEEGFQRERLRSEYGLEM